MRIGLIGCGRWGRNILRDLKVLDVSVTVIDPDPAARMHASANGADAVFDDVRQARDVDGWIVATPSTSHAQVIGDLLPTGIPIFCEKPLTCDPLSARQIVESAAEQVLSLIHI